jgi:hypothetical protein
MRPAVRAGDIVITHAEPAASFRRGDTGNQAGAMTWTPSAAATDNAGNAATTTAATQSGAVHVNF